MTAPAGVPASKEVLARALAALTAVASHGGTAGDLDEFFAVLSATVAGLVGASKVAFFALRDERTVGMQPGAFGFPSEVVAEAQAIPVEPGGETFASRLTFGDLPIFEQDTSRFAIGDERARQAGIDHVLGVPWSAADTRLGTLCAYNSTRGGFTDEDAWVLSIAAGAAALVWQERRARRRQRQREREIERMTAAARSLSSLERGAVERAVAEAALEVVATGRRERWRGSFGRLDGDEIVVVAADGRRAGAVEGMRYVISQRPPVEAALRKGTPQVGRFSEFAELDAVPADLRPTLPTATAAWCPVMVGGVPYGIVTVVDEQGGTFSEEQLDRLSYVAVLTGLAIGNALSHSSVEREAARMKELERVKSEFLKLASHELRGPLATIRGYAEMLSDGSLASHPDLAGRALDVLRAKAVEMEGVVSQLLEAARLEDGLLSLDMGTIDIRAAVEQVVSNVRVTLQPGLDLELVAAPDPIRVRADARRVVTIVGNLLDNAVKYSPNGGAVRVEVCAEGGEARVTVSDHGLGVAPGDVPRLFTRFGRIVTPGNSHIAGTGLGLYLSREVARMHGGDVTLARTEPGAGSEFLLALPLATGA